MKTLLLSIVSIFFFTMTASAATTLQVELVSTSTSVTSFADHDEGLFTVRVKLTAIGGDAYIMPHPLNPSGFFMLVYRNGSPSGASYTTVVDNLSSSTNEILEGDSHVFQTTTLVVPNLSGQYSVGIAEIQWSDGSSEYTSILGLDNIRTGYAYLGSSSTAPEPSRILLLGLGLGLMILSRRRN